MILVQVIQFEWHFMKFVGYIMICYFALIQIGKNGAPHRLVNDPKLPVVN
jgi:hypothetical protein